MSSACCVAGNGISCACSSKRDHVSVRGLLLSAAARSAVLRRRAALRAATLLAWALAGCYTYAPVEFDAAGRGASVRAQLSPAGEQEVIGRFGPGAREVRGRVLETGDGVLSVLVDAVLERQRVVAVDAAAVRLFRDHVQSLHEKRLSPRRTALFGAGVVAALVLLTESLGGTRRPNDTETDTLDAAARGAVPAVRAARFAAPHH